MVYPRLIRFLTLGLFAIPLPMPSAFAQAPSVAAGPVAPTPPQATAGSTPLSKDVQILYTGELLGYLGLPDQQQAKHPLTQCPSDPDPNTPAGRFIGQVRTSSLARLENAILLGAGDNFAPAVTSRLFIDPVDQTRPGKDTNTWDWKRQMWVPIVDSRDWKKSVSLTVQTSIAEGRGYLDFDNVGCFLKSAGYSAIVPGELDFYFGPERLRYLARFLATDTEKSRRVQMLGANLVIDTGYAKSRKPLPDADKDLKYVTKLPEFKIKKPPDVKFKNLTDGKPVLPWLQWIYIESTLALHEFRLCDMSPEDPSKIEVCRDQLSAICHDHNQIVPCPDPSEGKSTSYELGLPKIDSLVPGNNYAICLPELLTYLKPYETYGLCSRFSVYAPFFLYPNPSPKQASPGGQHYSDPEPYFLAEGRQTPDDHETPVAVFGVVDPNLRNHVGELNDSWKNSNKRYKTEILVIDPAEALDQELQYFERDYQEKHGGRKFEGIRVLLAQMRAPLARQLIARFPGKFNVVIPQADSELATPNETQSLRPMPEDPGYVDFMRARQQALQGTLKLAAAAPAESAHGTVNPAPSFVAVPPPYFDRALNHPVLQVRSLTISRPDQDIWEFNVSGGRRVEELVEQVLPIAMLCSDMVNAVQSATATRLACPPPSAADSAFSAAEQGLKSLTLTAIKDAFHADVALMQKRDFYFGRVPQAAGPGNNAAERLDRILWKGDLAVRSMVKGSTLVKVLQESDQFDAQDNQSLSLEVMKGRGLERLGIVKDPVRNEYLVNGEVIDPNRLYSVATTDYIGVGDTGYPEIVETGFDNAQQGADFPRQVSSIAGVVCTKLNAAVCPAPIITDAYLDELATVPFDQGPSLTATRQFWYWTHVPYLFNPGMHPAEARALIKAKGQSEVNAQDRRVWFLSHSSGAGLTAVDNNLSVAQQKADFSAISSPSQLQAKESHELIFTLKDKTGFRGRRVDGYFQPELNYDDVVTGQSVPPAVSNLKQNLLAGELGVFWHKLRDYPRTGLVLSARDESQVVQPVETVVLADPSRTTFNFSHQRTNWLFGHFGFRTENRHSYFEGGYELGDARRVTAFNFVGPAGFQSCPFAGTPAAQDEPTCVVVHSSGANPTITKQSTPTAAIGSAFRYGWYSTMQLVVPIHPRLSYIFTNQFDYFYAGQNSISTDMLYRDLWSNSLSLTITPNFSIAPKFDVFFYENQVEHNFFRQVQTSIALKYAFDWYSGSRWKTALRYTEPKQP
jgi:hypothetical protein